MKFKQYIQEATLQTGELQYITVRMEKAKPYLFGKTSKLTVEQICNILEHVFQEEVMFEEYDRLDSIDKESENVGISRAQYGGGYVSFGLNENVKTAMMKQQTWDRFVVILSDMFHHEMVHALQDQRMSDEQRSKEAKQYFKVLQTGKDEAYFKYPAELMAFAWTAVRELKRNGLNKEQILATLKNPESNMKKSFFMTEYHKYFAGKDRATWNKFLTHMYNYAKELKE